MKTSHKQEIKKILRSNGYSNNSIIISPNLEYRLTEDYRPTFLHVKIADEMHPYFQDGAGFLHEVTDLNFDAWNIKNETFEKVLNAVNLESKGLDVKGKISAKDLARLREEEAKFIDHNRTSNRFSAQDFRDNEENTRSNLMKEITKSFGADVKEQILSSELSYDQVSFIFNWAQKNPDLATTQALTKKCQEIEHCRHYYQLDFIDKFNISAETAQKITLEHYLYLSEWIDHAEESETPVITRELMMECDEIADLKSRDEIKLYKAGLIKDHIKHTSPDQRYFLISWLDERIEKEITTSGTELTEKFLRIKNLRLSDEIYTEMSFGFSGEEPKMSDLSEEKSYGEDFNEESQVEQTYPEDFEQAPKHEEDPTYVTNLFIKTGNPKSPLRSSFLPSPLSESGKETEKKIPSTPVSKSAFRYNSFPDINATTPKKYQTATPPRTPNNNASFPKLGTPNSRSGNDKSSNGKH